VSIDVEYVAVPADSVPVPSGLEPSMNATVPVALEGATVAVNVTDWPYADVDDDDASIVVVGAPDVVATGTTVT
jgi:hypothetical protein